MAEPLEGTIVISVLRANKLPNLDRGGISDPFVEIRALGPDGATVLMDYRTTTKNNTLDPVWNEPFSLIMESAVPQVTVELQAFDEDIGGSSESMGYASVVLNSKSKWETEQTLTFKPKKKEKVSGSLVVSFEYQKGKKVDVNAKAEKTKKKKQKASELPKDAVMNMKEWRANKSVFTEGEEEKMKLLSVMYISNFGTETPVFGIEKKKLAGLYSYQKSTYSINQNDMLPDKWMKMLVEKPGDFINEAKQIVKVICEFQQKKQDSFRDGYLNDPEGLFCEEVKLWTVKEFSSMSITNASKSIEKRIAYLEECLLVSNLFDRPSGTAKGTIQQAIVEVRKILKYRAIANIEKELAHEDATRSFSILKKNLSGVIFEAYELLKFVFKNGEEDNIPDSNTNRLLRCLECDKNVKTVLSNSKEETKDNLRGVSGSVDASWEKLDCGKLGLKPTLQLIDPAKNDVKDPVLVHVLTGEISGVEKWFRGNPFVALKFLRAHGLLLEVGRLFVVIEKASNLAKSGGTLLVFGLGNAHLNATLDATSLIIDAVKDELNAVTKIAEVCFEELVEANQATRDRTPWVGHFQKVFPAIREINRQIKEVHQVVSDIKLTANSVSFVERIEKAASEQTEFVATAEEFSKRMAAVTGKPYVPPKVKEPTAEDSKAWMELITQNK